MYGLKRHCDVSDDVTSSPRASRLNTHFVISAYSVTSVDNFLDSICTLSIVSDAQKQQQQTKQNCIFTFHSARITSQKKLYLDMSWCKGKIVVLLNIGVHFGNV